MRRLECFFIDIQWKNEIDTEQKLKNYTPAAQDILGQTQMIQFRASDLEHAYMTFVK